MSLNILDDRTPEEIDALPWPTAVRATPANCGFALKEGGDPAILEDLAEYLKPFAAPPENDDHPCLRCGSPQCGGMVQAFLGGGFRWGLAHGEGNCSACGWPARLYHFVKDRHGKDLMTIRGLLLQYHPDEVHRAVAGQSQ